MAKFAWEGKSRTGKAQKGVMEAPDSNAVSAALRRQGIMPSSVKETGKGLSMEIKLPGFAPKITTPSR